jgi:hypothetical protein
MPNNSNIVGATSAIRSPPRSLIDSPPLPTKRNARGSACADPHLERWLDAAIVAANAIDVVGLG